MPQRPAVVVRPGSTEEVSAVLAACNEATVPVTAAAGRSGVCGGSIPVHGGVALDLTALHGVRQVDETSLTADVRAGTFGPDLEAALGEVGAGYTLGHWPQSMDLSTVGGWLACRGAGQYSTRYGKIEDMVIGLEVVLADGRVVHTEGKGPRAATGPNLTQLFVGSEGTLGVITEARLRVHPLPPAQGRRAFGFTTFAAGLEACRMILRRGATPAVLRLYDETESERNFEQGDTNVLIVLDEADTEILSATLRIVDATCSSEAGAHPLDESLVERWLGHRKRRVGPGTAVAGRDRRRHGRDLRFVVRPPRSLRRGHRRAAGDRRDAGRLRPPVPRLPRRCLPLLHIRRTWTR